MKSHKENDLSPEELLENELAEMLKESDSSESQALQKTLSTFFAGGKPTQLRQCKIDFAIKMFNFFNSDEEKDKDLALRIHQYLLNKAYLDDYLCKQLFNAIDSSVESLKAASNIVLLEDLKIKGREVIGDPEFYDKQESQGKQFGIKVSYKYQDQYKQNGSIIYYVKAHDKYHISSSKQPTGHGPSIPDLKELLVYKILEHSGFGSKSHFIFNPFSRAGLFIATQDAGFTKFSTEVKEKSFNTATKQSEKPDFIAKIEQEREQIGVNNEKIKITALDIIARIFRLTDLNTDNYGYVNTRELKFSSTEKNKLKIIDFKVREEECYDISGRIYNDFKSGNSEFSYTGFAGKLLKNREEVEKIQLGNMVLENMLEIPRGNKKTINDAIASAFEDVINYVNGDSKRKEKLGISEEHVLDLEKYVSEVTKNYDSLKQNLLQNKTELEQQGKG